jgi:response regulator NasT
MEASPASTSQPTCAPRSAPVHVLSAFADDATVAQVKALGAVAYLVKPLDLSQIVPTVEAALSSVRARRAQTPPGPLPGAAPTVPAGADPLADPIPVAVGVLMHRYSLPRTEALARLHRLAEADGRSLHAQATALLDAVELLWRPNSGLNRSGRLCRLRLRPRSRRRGGG